MKYLLILTLFMGPLLLMGQKTVQIKGSVYDGVTKAPIANSKVVFFTSDKSINNTITTDESGTFVFKTVAKEGEKLYFLITKSGYNEHKTAKRVKTDGKPIEIVCYLYPE